MDKKHEAELRQLAGQGLLKMGLRGIGKYETTVIVHKNVPNKISRDFIERGQELVVFIDRNEDKPAKCYLYRSSRPMLSSYLLTDELEKEIGAENDDLEDCTLLVFKKEKES